jgi:hypothetical protein
MRYSYGRDNPVSPDGQRNRDNGAYVNHRQSGPFNLFYDRCTATSTGASSGCDYDGVYVLLLELLRYFAPEA